VGAFIRDASMAELERYSSELRELGVEVSARVEIGDPVETILAVVEEVQPVMIVMGTHGRTGLAHLLMGSIAEKVMRRADRPVLTVPAKHAKETAG
jgi:nucleotide-binding universal stress UspA family protein